MPSTRGGPRGRGGGYNGRGSRSGSRQDPIDDVFADTSVRDPAGLSNRVDPPYTLRRASRSQNQVSISSQPSVSSWLTCSQTQIQLGESSNVRGPKVVIALRSSVFFWPRSLPSTSSKVLRGGII